MYTANEKRYDEMRYNRCGRSGLVLSAFSLGMWHNFGTYNNYGNMVDIVTTAFDLGITHFDLANNYGPEPGSAEGNFGKMLRNELRPYHEPDHAGSWGIASSADRGKCGGACEVGFFA